MQPSYGRHDQRHRYRSTYVFVSMGVIIAFLSAALVKRPFEL
jgi:hypothetical protein